MELPVLSVSIVLPCLNEADTIGECVERAREALNIILVEQGLTGEIIVADNGSTDGSQQIARQGGARVVDISERGYGAALIGGFNAARGKYLVMGDSDCSYDFVEAVPMVAKLVEGADVCMGSRFKGGIAPGAMPWKNKYIGNPALSAILRFLVKTDIDDAHCGLRALRREAFKEMRLTSTGMEFASEMVLKAALKKLKIEEVPVTLSPDKRGRPPHLNPWRDGFRHLFFMLMLCPSPLFFAPAALLFGLGFTILAALVVDSSDMIYLGSFAIGDHWAVAASASLILSVQIALFGLIALAQAYRDQIRIPTGLAGEFLRRSQIHHWIFAGLLLAAGGFTWAGGIAAGWVSSDFGSLDAVRSFLAAFTMLVIGMQVVFTGFLLSIVSGNRLRHAPS